MYLTCTQPLLQQGSWPGINTQARTFNGKHLFRGLRHILVLLCYLGDEVGIVSCAIHCIMHMDSPQRDEFTIECVHNPVCHKPNCMIAYKGLRHPNLTLNYQFSLSTLPNMNRIGQGSIHTTKRYPTQTSITAIF